MAKEPENKRMAFAAMLEEAINDPSAPKQVELANKLGYTNGNVLTMFKRGTTRLPLDKVVPMAQALSKDPGVDEGLVRDLHAGHARRCRTLHRRICHPEREGLAAGAPQELRQRHRAAIQRRHTQLARRGAHTLDCARCREENRKGSLTSDPFC